MLNGLEPIIIFTFYKKDPNPALESVLSQIPLISADLSRAKLPPIPVYLSEELTGLVIDDESKSVDIETSTDTLASGADPKVNQKGINSIVRISLQASSKSIGVTLIAALCDLIMSKVTSQEYDITYLHKAVTVFGGLLHSFQITQNANDDRYNIEIELARGGIKTQPTNPVTEVSKNSTGPVPVGL